MKNEEKIKKIYSDIKSVKIQGATNVAKSAVRAYLLNPSGRNKRNLMSLRPTEPMLTNALNNLPVLGEERVVLHFDEAQKKINRFVMRIVKNGDIIYTHCHSTNVVKALIYAKKNGKRFSVANTETRPLYQGRKTAKELAKQGIRVTTFADSAMDDAIEMSSKIFLGADALLKDKIINKIGSEAIAEIAYLRNKPVYIIADSWKFSPKNVRVEERDFREVWKYAPKNVKIKNPAFEKVEKKYIKEIISELGIQKYDKFVQKSLRS